MPATLEELLISCTVRITCVHDGGVVSGTGFFVAPGTILTCAHVVAIPHPDGSRHVETGSTIAANWQGRILPAIVAQAFPNAWSTPAPYPDIALLTVNELDHPCVLLASDQAVDDQLYAYGYSVDYPDGESITPKIEGPAQSGGTGEDHRLIKFKDGQFRRGLSGSPLLNRRTGAVCGMAKRTRGNDFGGYAVSSAAVLSLAPYLREAQHVFHARDGRWRSLMPNRMQKAGAQADDLQDHWIPKARSAELSSDAWYFTGRASVLRALVSWLSDATSGRKIHVVTGSPGTGKSAILARLVTLADEPTRRTIDAAQALNGIDAGTIPPLGTFNLALNARGKTLLETLDAVATAASINAKSVASLISALKEYPERFRLVVDSLDEATEAGDIATQLLRELATLPHVWVLVGTRPDVVAGRGEERRFTRLGLNTVEIDLDRSEYFGSTDIVSYVERRLLAVNEPERRTPYRDKPLLAAKVATAVADRSGLVFLIAYIVTRNLLEADNAVDIESPAWRETFPSDVGAAFDAYLDRFNVTAGSTGLAKSAVLDLLRPMAFSEGLGLPRKFIAPLASAIAGRRYTSGDVDLLMAHASAYIVPVSMTIIRYRLYHEALAEHVRAQVDATETQEIIAKELMQSVPAAADGTRDWARADPYVTSHLADHAAKASLLQELLGDPGFLITADTNRLARIIDPSHEEPIRTIATIHGLIRDRLAAGPLRERASYLSLTAMQYDLKGLYQRTLDLNLDMPWHPLWSDWRPVTRHKVVTRLQNPGQIAMLLGNDESPIMAIVIDKSMVAYWDISRERLLREPFSIRPSAQWYLRSPPQILDILPVRGEGGIVLAVLDDALMIRFFDIDGQARAEKLASEMGVIERGFESEPHYSLGRWDSIRRLRLAEVNGSVAVVGTTRKGSLFTLTPDGKFSDWVPGFAYEIAVVHGATGPLVVSCDPSGYLDVKESSGRHVFTDYIRAERCTTLSARANFLGTAVCVGYGDGSIYVAEFRDGSVSRKTLFRHANEVLGVAIAYDQEAIQLYSTGGDGTLRKWDISDEIATVSATARRELDFLCSFRHEGREVLVQVGLSQSTRMIDPATGAIVATGLGLGKILDAPYGVLSICPTARGVFCTVSEPSGRLRSLIDPFSGRLLTCPASGHYECAVVFDDHGILTLLACNSDTFRTWRKRWTGWREDHTARLDSGAPLQVLAAVSMNGVPIVAAGCANGDLLLLNGVGRSMHCMSMFARPSGISSLNMIGSQNRCYLAIGSQHGLCELAEVGPDDGSFESLATIDLGSAVRSIALLPRSEALVASCLNGIACLHVPAFGERLRQRGREKPEQRLRSS
jgi:Trypsin-like peptidase domain